MSNGKRVIALGGAGAMGRPVVEVVRVDHAPTGRGVVP